MNFSFSEKKQKISFAINRLVELGCKPADRQEAMKTVEFPFYDDPKQQIESDYQPKAVEKTGTAARV